MFSQSPAHQIERLLPVLVGSRKARLLTELYAQAIEERLKDFQHFRLWALLEQVAREWWEQTKPKGPLLHPNGQVIRFKNGDLPNDNTACVQVYRFLQSISYRGHRMLRQNKLGQGAVIEGTTLAEQDPALELITLWDALRAALEWRNQVAHVGRFTGGSTPEQALAERLYWDGPILDGFVGKLSRQVLFQELEREATALSEDGTREY